MYQPLGFRSNPGKILKLMKALYGLKQALREWFTLMTKELAKHVLKPTRKDRCFFQISDGTVFAILHVDDLLMGHTENVDSLVKSLKTKFELTVCENPKKFLGLNIRRDRDQKFIFLNQSH